MAKTHPVTGSSWLPATFELLNYGVPSGENEDGSFPLVYNLSTGTGTAYVLALEFGLTNTKFPNAAYMAGLSIRFNAHTANTAACTINVNSLGAKSIKRPDGSDLAADDIQSGDIVHIVYDGTNFVINNLRPSIVQVVDSVDGAVATGTTLLPIDDTIPQSSEGDQYLSVSITPKHAANRLLVEVQSVASNSYGGAHHLSAALFQDSVADALQAVSAYAGAGDTMRQFRMVHDMAAGGTSLITFKVRIGADQAGTTTFNGRAGARVFGGVCNSYIRVIEYRR